MNRKKDQNDVILQYGGWIIKKDSYGYIFHHVNDEKMNHARYPSTLAGALELLHEEILLNKRLSNGYDGSIKAFRNAIIETHKEFEQLLSPKILDMVKEDIGCKKVIA